MDARTFLGLEPRSEDLRQWRLEVTSAIATPGRFLFGGCGLGAGIEAMEAASGRPCVWAAAQYLSYAPVGSLLDLDVTLAVTGHQMSQARCVGRVGDKEIFTVNSALGRRSLEHRGLWAQRPDVPGPDGCPARDHGHDFEDTIMGRVQTRLAAGRQHIELDGSAGDGRCALWCRMPEMLEPSAASLAVLGDFVPSGIGQALGLAAGGNSLDNTLRVAQLVPTEWVLVDLRIHAIEHGFGHGLAHLWAENGTLLATASQSVIVRFWDGRR
ncbi:MAG: thioesterase family protein [Acidimicrobiales bacterium]